MKTIVNPFPSGSYLYSRPTHWILPTLITDELVRSLSVVSMQLALKCGKVVYDTNVLNSHKKFHKFKQVF